MAKLIKVSKSPAYRVVENFLNGKTALIETVDGLVQCTKVEACGKYIYMYAQDGNIYYYDNSRW